MFTRPGDLDDDTIVRRLADSWGLAVEDIRYEPVGFGSHHWIARAASRSWFVTVDDLDVRLLDDGDDRGAALARLDAALTTAWSLHEGGHDWVVAPVPSRTAGRILERLDDRHVCAVFPFIEGRASAHGHYDVPEERRAVVAVLADLHAAADPGTTIDDDHRIPRRDALVVAMRDALTPWATGPFAEPARHLVAEHRDDLERVLRRFDDLAAAVRRRRSSVVTHGEPHRGNVIFTPTGPVLIDWDTARRAPAERDLWSLVLADPAIRHVYEDLAGRTLDDDALRLYELTWDLCEVALFVHEFRQPHERNADTETAWRGLAEHLDASRWADLL